MGRCEETNSAACVCYLPRGACHADHRYEGVCEAYFVSVRHSESVSITCLRHARTRIPHSRSHTRIACSQAYAHKSHIHTRTNKYLHFCSHTNHTCTHARTSTSTFARTQITHAHTHTYILTKFHFQSPVRLYSFSCI